MPVKKFFIGPPSEGMITRNKPLFFNAVLGIISKYTKKGVMELKKSYIDITNKRFYNLTALRPIEKSERYRKERGVFWECKCDCGNICIASGGALRRGGRKSCGCRSLSRIYESGINRVFFSYKAKAKKRKLEFSIEKEIFEKLLMGNCLYCDRSPSNILKRLKTKKLQLQYNGIDRYDPSKGYTNDNCVSCCYYCNHAKLDLTFEEFKEQVLRRYKWLSRSSL